MKKILYFLLLLFCIPFSIYGITGNGTYGSPYSGPLTADMTWSGTVYVNGDVTVDGFTLTISPGSIIVFLTPGADLIITGTGVLTASGGSGTNMIRFTADSDNSGTFGGAGETWGHISFQYMTSGFTTPSIINYCIIEFGQKNTNPLNVDAMGGGIYSDFSYLTISNSTIRNNYAGYGGGMFITQCNPSIYNCIINNNIAGITGGGIVFYVSCPSLVSNCVIYDNICTGPGGAGGIFAGYEVGNLRLFNCVIATNTSTYNSGNNIRFYNNSAAPYPTGQNTIIWGSINSIDYSNSPQLSSNFVNCAMQGGAASYTNCINISGTNNDPTGPNFYNVTSGSEDYRLNFLSPCRDAGSTTVPPLSSDIQGNLRVGPYDIGAYEVQYSRWTGATDEVWSVSSNWSTNTVPIASSNVVVPVTTISPRITVSDAEADNLIIEAGSSLDVYNFRTLRTYSSFRNSGSLTISPSAFADLTTLLNEGTFTILPAGRSTVTTLTNNGIINLNDDGAGMSSLILDGYSGTGTANIEMYVFGGGGTNNWKWHYVAVPANGISKTVFTDHDPYDLLLYDDSQIPNTLTATDNDGWVYHDGYKPGVDPPTGPFTGPSFSDLFIGRGYAFYHPASNAIVNLNNLTSLQSSIGSLPLQYSGGGKLVPANYGFNLLGNSLTCGLDWNLVTETGDVNDVIYYTINYKIGAYVRNGGGINGASKNIPPLQGFLVKANATGASLNFSAARQHTLQLRYKKGSGQNESDLKAENSAAPMVKLELNNSGNQDETLVWLNENATNGFDGSFDGAKFFSGSGFDQIYTINGTQKFGINGIPLPATSVTIPVAVKIIKAGSGYKIIASELQGFDNYNVTLTDKGNSNFVVDLKSINSYTFSSEAGTFQDRFILTIGSNITGIPELIVPEKPFNVFAFDKTLNIDLLDASLEGRSGTVNVYNLYGIRVLQQDNVEWYRDDLKKIPLNLPQGIYIVELKTENQKFVSKINLIK